MYTASYITSWSFTKPALLSLLPHLDPAPDARDYDSSVCVAPEYLSIGQPFIRLSLTPCVAAVLPSTGHGPGSRDTPRRPDGSPPSPTRSL